MAAPKCSLCKKDFANNDSVVIIGKWPAGAMGFLLQATTFTYPLKGPEYYHTSCFKKRK